jgi:hypothetical protein
MKILQYKRYLRSYGKHFLKLLLTGGQTSFYTKKEEENNHKRFYRLMTEMNLQAKIRKKKQKYRKGSQIIIVSNVLDRNFTAKKTK